MCIVLDVYCILYLLIIYIYIYISRLKIKKLKKKTEKEKSPNIGKLANKLDCVRLMSFE